MPHVRTIHDPYPRTPIHPHTLQHVIEDPSNVSRSRYLDGFGFPTERKVNPDAPKFRTTPATTKLTVNLNFLPLLCPSLPEPGRMGAHPFASKERGVPHAVPHQTPGNRAIPLRSVNYKALGLPESRQGPVRARVYSSRLPPRRLLYLMKRS